MPSPPKNISNSVNWCGLGGVESFIKFFSNNPNTNQDVTGSSHDYFFILNWYSFQLSTTDLTPSTVAFKSFFFLTDNRLQMKRLEQKARSSAVAPGRELTSIPQYGLCS